MKKLIPFLILSCALIFVSCNKKNGTGTSADTTTSVESVESAKKIVASTSWTAAFADLAGLDNVEAIAPANLRHPPEYEVTVSDIQKISDSDIFIFAGFEVMMKTLGTSIDGVNMVKISCDNSIATVTKEAAKIAEITGTQEESKKRVTEYVNTIAEGQNRVINEGLKGAIVYCNVNQVYLAKDLGFEIGATFGPGPVTSEQIAVAKEQGFAFIIDNIHNPTGAPLAEVSDAEYIIWRNFPEKVEHNALKTVVQENIDAIFTRG